MTQRTIRQFVPIKPEERMTEAESIASARHSLHAQAQADRERLDADPVKADGEPVEVTLQRDEAGEPIGYEPVTDGPVDGHVVTWTATSSPIPEAREEARVKGRLVYEGTVPAQITEQGGTVRLIHDIGGPVTVEVEDADGKPMGYLVSTAVSRNEEQVEVMPGTYLVRGIRDSDLKADG